MKKYIILSMMAMIIVSCAPSNFIRTSSVTWSTVELRDNLEFDEAWNKVVDVLAKKFELEVISKDGSYLRSGWIYTWNTKGNYTKNYRNRVVIKFSSDRKNVEIKAEAQYGSAGKWKNGFDSRLLQTLKQDIMGVVGRTTR